MQLSTDTRPFTIQGVTLNIPLPAIEVGHACTEGEASSLKQTFVENVRNNLASEIKEAKEKGAAPDVLQKIVDEYCTEYEFGVRAGGVRLTDPVEAAAREIAIELAKRAVRKSGKSLKDYGMDQIRVDADGLLNDAVMGDKIRSKATAIAAARSEALDL